MDRPRSGGGNGWSDWLQRAQAAGLHTNIELVSLAPDRTAQVALPCLPYLDSIVINELEAGALAGIEAPAPAADGPLDWPVLEAMALALIEHGVSVLAVVPFPAGVILGLHEGWPVERSLRLAVASAAASVRSPNTSDGIKPADTCLAEADQAGYRPAQ
jgi:sugar/nucleoside kinase (ribokinase family)